MPSGEGFPERKTEQYYGGANWLNWFTAPGDWYQEVGNIGDSRSGVRTSTGTYQFFDQASCPWMKGPYESTASRWEEPVGTSILVPWAWGGGQFHWTGTVTRGGFQALWFHRMAYCKMFAKRMVANVAGGGVMALNADEPMFFVVAERYPFIIGTGYINDLPQIWVGLIYPDGRVFKELRAWSYGYAGAELITANGHHVVWCLYTGALNPQPHYYVRDLDSDLEHEFANDAMHTLLSGEVMDTLKPTDISFFIGANAKLFTPEFLWSDRVPEKFFIPGSLPTTTEEKVLEEYAHLSGGQAYGSTRIINDQTVLLPLGIWQGA